LKTETEIHINLCEYHEETISTFYRAMLRRARYCHGRSSVCPSVTLTIVIT